MSIGNNKEVYTNIEYNSWASRKGLLTEEKYLIEKYLDKKGKTLEAGVGAGRILFEMTNLGFESLYGFDYMPELIKQAKQRDTNHSICFEVQDAISLNYEDDCFAQIIYLQQFISLIEDEIGRLKALKEAYRVLKSGGTALFSFLNFEVRNRSVAYLPYLMYLRLYRKLRGLNRSIQYLPLLKLGGKFNFSSLLDTEPYVYWYNLQEAYQILTEVGFEIVAIGSSYQIKQGRMHVDLETLVDESIEGMLYFVCKK